MWEWRNNILLARYVVMYCSCFISCDCKLFHDSSCCESGVELKCMRAICKNLFSFYCLLIIQSQYLLVV